MSIIKLLAVGAITTITLTATSGVARAESLQVTQEKLVLSQLIKTPYFGQLEVKETTLVKPIEEKKEPEPPKAIEYVVVANDNLTKIAELHQTTWERIWQKNIQLANPNIIDVGDKLVIPLPDEALEPRAIPIQSPPPTPVQQATVSHQNYSSAGNTYGYGYCTWYAKNRRPDLPNSLGNANTWYARASNKGTTPVAGAIGATTAGSLGHVVYVERVNGDGTIYISEMNYQGWNVVSYRTASADEFLYIY